MRLKTRVLSGMLVFLMTVFSIPVADISVFADSAGTVNATQWECSVTIEQIRSMQNYLLNDTDGVKLSIDESYDLNDDGTVNVFDLTILKRRYLEQTEKSGNFYSLSSELIQSSDITEGTTIMSDDFYSKRVIVKTTSPYDFTSFSPINVISGLDNIYVLQFDSVEKTELCISSLSQDNSIQYVELDEYMNCEDISADETAEAYSWGVSEIEADQYAEYLGHTYDTSVVVAVVDTGVASHDFLSGRILDTGYDMVDNDTDPYDEHYHGTHVSGTIVDCTPGLNIKILPVRVLNSNGEGSFLNVANGIRYAVEHGANVINLSLGSMGCSEYIDDSINYAIKNGVTVVVAAGNDTADTSNYCPAHIENCIVVTACDTGNKIANFSNYGSSVDLTAPGVSIVSCIPGGGYKSCSGTSMAVSHIAAAAAMIKYSNPQASPAEIENLLKEICLDLGDSGSDIYYGYGIPKLSNLIPEEIEPTIELLQDSLSLYSGDAAQLTADVYPAGQTISWSSSNTSVATVKNGTITAKSEGTTYITASVVYRNAVYSDVCCVTVTAPKLEIDKTSLTMYVGDKDTITATTIPSFGAVTWSSSNDKIASVDGGVITAEGEGTATIAIKYTYAGTALEENAVVTVKSPGIILNSNELKMYVGDQDVLKPTMTPGTDANSSATFNVLWSTSDSSVVRVTDGGTVTGVSVGTAVVTAVYVYNGHYYSDKCIVTVEEVPCLILSASSKSMYVGDTATLTATTTPSGQTVTWMTSNSSVATVSGGTITAKAAGTATITAKFTYNSTAYTATCTVTVTKPTITLSASSKSMYVGDTATLTATTTPSGQTVTWTTSNSSVATVSGGTITAKAVGTATITAKFTYNGTTYSATCTVTVTKPTITLSSSSKTIYSGNTATITATTTPSGLTVSWSTSNSSVATVSGGTITARSSGTAYIYAKITYGGYTYTATCTVTVQPVSVTLSSSSGSANVSVFNMGVYTYNSTTQAAYKVALPSATYSPSGASYSWSLYSGNGWVSGTNLYVTQPGTVIAKLTVTNNGYTATAYYTYTFSTYKTTEATNNIRSGAGTSYSILSTIPAGTTISFQSIASNGTPGGSGSSLWGKVTYGGVTGWIIISQW